MQSNLCVIQHRANARKRHRILQSLTAKEMFVGISEPQLKSLIEYTGNLRRNAQGSLEEVKGWLCKRPKKDDEIKNFQVITEGIPDGKSLYYFLKNRFTLESDSQRL